MLEFLQAQLASAFSQSSAAGYAVYLALGSVRGFTLIPSTTLVLAAVPFLAPTPLFILTLIGIAISSSCIYAFSGALGLERRLAARHPVQVRRIHDALERHELPIIVGWSFLPFTPTDLICYVCGILRVNFLKFLGGVCLGEGAICGIYIYSGDSLMRWLGWR